MEDKTKKILLISGISLVSVLIGFFIYKLIKRKMSVVYVEGEEETEDGDEQHEGQVLQTLGGMAREMQL